MEKHCLKLIFIVLLISCSKKESIDRTIKIDQSEILEREEEINLGPNDFELEIINITHDNATLSWSQAEDPENDLVTYSIYINENLIVEGKTTLMYQLDKLEELTTYTGELIAVDAHNNKTVKTFSFSTIKYYLKYLKTFDFGHANNDTGYASGKTTSMIKSSDQSYLITGSAQRPDASGDHLFILKIDYEGNELWKKFYDYKVGNSTEIKIIESRTGYILVGGYYIISLDFFGNLIWDKIIGTHSTEDPWARVISVVEDEQGNIFTVGNSHITENPEIPKVGVLTKYDSSGSLIWERRYGNSCCNDFVDIIISKDGDLIILGSTETGGFTREDHISGDRKQEIDFWLFKLSREGEEIWNKTYGDYRFDFPKQIIQKSNGNYLIVGYGWGAYDISKGRIFEIDQDGNELLNITNDLSTTNSIAETHDGGLVLTGIVEFGNYGALGVYKYDSSGNEEYNRQFQENFTHLWGYAIIAEPDGGYKVAGTSWRFYYYGDEKPEILVYKTDPQGYFN